ncbi:pentapeptide repeat-containing protein [Pontimicrobium sp. MEBiC06410]
MENEYKKITQEELDLIIKKHELWLTFIENGLYKSLSEEAERANLSGYIFENINFKKRKLDKAIIRGSSFNNVSARESSFINVDFSGSKFDKSFFQLANFDHSIFTKCTFLDIDFIGSSFKKANFNNTFIDFSDFPDTKFDYSSFIDASINLCNFTRANFRHSNLFNVSLNVTNFNYAIFRFANLRHAKIDNCRFNEADFSEADLREVSYDEISNIDTISNNKKKDIILDSQYKIDEINLEFKEKSEELKSKDKDDPAYKKLKLKFEELEKAKGAKEKELNLIIKKEKEAKEKTEKQITAAVNELRRPNDYISSQFNIQIALAALHFIFFILTIVFLRSYIDTQYVEFKNALTKETTLVNLLFYVSPIAFCFSLIVIFINQINKRVTTSIQLNESKREIDSIEGSLKALHALSINNEDSRKQISTIMHKIIDNTISTAKKDKKEIIQNEEIEAPLETLKKIKDLLP